MFCIDAIINNHLILVSHSPWLLLHVGCITVLIYFDLSNKIDTSLLSQAILKHMPSIYSCRLLLLMAQCSVQKESISNLHHNINSYFAQSIFCIVFYRLKLIQWLETSRNDPCVGKRDYRLYWSEERHRHTFHQRPHSPWHPPPLSGTHTIMTDDDDVVGGGVMLLVSMSLGHCFLIKRQDIHEKSVKLNRDVFVVGSTNAGKSSIFNSMIVGTGSEKVCPVHMLHSTIQYSTATYFTLLRSIMSIV